MNALVFQFRWLSPLGIAVIIFLLYGVMNAVSGALTPFFVRPDRLFANTILTSERTDTALFGASPQDLIAQNKPLGLLHQLTSIWLGGLMLGLGLFQLAVTWFGLRQGQVWALWTLTVSDLALAPFWVPILNAYARVGAMPGIGEMPPFIPFLIAIPIAAVLGWIGLR